jgi:hypothetical protein
MAGRSTTQFARLARWARRPWLRALFARWRPALGLACAASLVVPSGGCTRLYYRKKADEEVSEVLAQKDKFPDWRIENWHVYPDPQARFAECGDPDHPPKPPDDPAAFAMSPNPQKPGKAGVARVEGNGYLELIAHWDRENRDRRTKEEADEERGAKEPPVVGDPEPVDDPHGLRPVLALERAPDRATPERPAGEPAKAPPDPRDPIAEAKSRSLIDITDRPAFLLTLDQAAELAMFNSREYQDQRESLYLAALPVTLQRFAFGTQFFAASQAIREYFGRRTPTGPANDWALNNGVGFSKILPTGALLLLSFSNQTVFDFINHKTVSESVLNFQATQPLLRGGGKAVALEGLTQAERNLLYAIRNFARFRKSLYVAIASSNGGAISGSSFQPTGVLSSTGVNATSGLGFSGLTPGVVPPVSTTGNGPAVTPGSPGTLALSGAITPSPSGYLNTMLQKIQVYIDQENIDTLSAILLRYRGLLEGDMVQPVQVQSVEQQLLTGRATLLTDQQQYMQSLDAFKLLIGVPTNLSIETDDSTLRPLLKQFRRSRAIIESEQAALAQASALIAPENAPRLRVELRRLFRSTPLVRGTAFARNIGARWAEWERLNTQDLADRLAALRKQARALLDRQAEMQKNDQLPTAADRAALRDVTAQTDLGNFELALRRYELDYVEQGRPRPVNPAGERRRLTAFQGVVYAWQKVLVEARDEQWATVRAGWPELPRCCVDGVDLIHDDLARAQAVGAQHALLNRLDLMNVRAQLVDSWRQLAIYANSLLGTFNVAYQLNSYTPPGGAQPLNIGGSGNAHQLILSAAPPLVRVQERNNYRVSLIAHQRQRRALQEAEDLTVQAIRGELYLLRQFADQYRLQQRQLELAYLTIDNSLESLEAPTAPPAPPGVTQARSGPDGPAALTQQLLSAQRTLPAAQNALLTVWINYLNARLQLYRDLELMPLDARGVWIDEIRDCDCGVFTPAGSEAPGTTPAPQPLPPLTAPEVK